MDVRCERCKTEYEFDDARITEAGVTVKCTTCGHVFKVKKKALVVTVPVKGEEAQAATPVTAAAPPQPTPTPAAAASPAEKPREWKVKQSNGNVFTFKELTTLQKWIVERKVSRDDEISLTGESWKRLGNIAELASFFQVVEEAQKAAQLSAMQSGGYGAYGQPMVTPAGGLPMPNVGATPVPPNAPTQVVQQPVVPPPPLHSPAPQQPGQPPSLPNHDLAATGVVPPQEPPPPRKPNTDTLPFTQPPKKQAPVMSAQRRAPVDEEPDYEAAGMKKGGGAGKFVVVLLVLALLGGAGYYGYFYWYLPQEQAKADAEAAAKKADLEKNAKVPANTVPPVAPVAAVEDAGVDAGAPVVVDAGHVAPVVDAGVIAPAVVDAGTPVVKKEPPRDFDWYMAQGDKLRDREKPSAALDMYGKAADMQPDRAEPMAGRGLALLDMGQKPQAEASFQQALKVNPRYGVALMGLAETYRAMGQKADAIKYYQKYLDVLPNGPEAPVAKEAVRRLQNE